MKFWHDNFDLQFLTNYELSVKFSHKVERNEKRELQRASSSFYIIPHFNVLDQYVSLHGNILSGFEKVTIQNVTIQTKSNNTKVTKSNNTNC